MQAAQALAQSISSALKSIISRALSGLGAIGGVIGSFAGGILDGLIKKYFGKKDKPQPVTVENVVRTMPANLNYDLAANPNSRLISGRAFSTGASYAQPNVVTINAAPGLGELIIVKVAGALRLSNAYGGVR